MRLRRIVILCLMLVALLASAGGCDDTRFDESDLYKGMDRSVIIATYGLPDKSKVHTGAERLTYVDGEHYQYLLMLIDGKLVTWQQDRVYQESKFSNIRNSSGAGDAQTGR